MDRFERQRQDRDRLASQLARDYAMDLPQYVTDRVFALAWSEGHANGEGEVESYYVDLADLASEVYREGQRRGHH